MSEKYINPTYADKATRDRLGDKSMLCFGARGKWRKLADKYGLDVKNIEKQMDEIIRIKREAVNARFKKTESGETRPEQSTATHDTTNGVGSGSESTDVRGPEIREEQLETGNEVD